MQQLAPSGTPPSSIYRMKFTATGTEFALVVLKNLLLTLVTFGFYAAWAKTERRRFIWQNTQAHDQRLAYTGTGPEIFRGYLKVVAAYIAFLVATNVLSVVPGLQFLPSIVLAFLVPYAIYSSRAYLLSRTRWRGISLGLAEGGRREYVKMFVWGWFLTIFTLGLYGPIRGNRLHSILLNHSRVGTLRARYTGTDRDAFGIFLRAAPWLVLTLGIYWFWYRAKVLQFRMENTWLDRARGRLEVRGGDLLGLYLLNIVALLLTLGLAFPWIATNNLSFFLDRMRLEGEIDFAAIEQKTGGPDAFGDGLADALDADIGL